MRVLGSISLLAAALSATSSLRVSHHTQRSDSTFPAQRICFVGSGHSTTKGCNHAPAMDAVLPCDSNSNQACLKETSIDVNAKGYRRTISTTAEWDSLTSAVVEAEGGGFGASVSVGFTYLKQAKTAESSVGLFLGSSLQTKTVSVENPGRLQPTSSANFLMGALPQRFAGTYGFGYVHSMTYGGSFIGSYTLNERNSSSENNLEVFVKIGAEKDTFSAAGSVAFQNARKEVGTNLEVNVGAQWSGGTDLRQDYSSPATMQKMFDDWDTSLRVAPAPMLVSIRSWTDSSALQESLDTWIFKNVSLWVEMTDLLNQRPISQTFNSVLSKENIDNSYTLDSVNRAMTWKETTNRRLTCHQDLRGKILRHAIDIDNIDDMRALELQKEFMGGNNKWFQSPGFKTEYKRCNTL